jgi:hypothetical protein
MAIQILDNCTFDCSKIQTLWVGSRLIDGNPIVHPIQYLTISGSSDSIIRVEAWDTINDIVTIGGQQIVVNKITNLGDNLTFGEELRIDQNGKVYVKSISFIIPSLTLFLINQLKEFTVTSNGLAQLAPTIAFLVDENDQTLVVGHDKPLYLDSTDFKIGDTNDVTLGYSSRSYSRARAYQIQPIIIPH